jgi:O-antigen/teichoic acid export membrane protein
MKQARLIVGRTAIYGVGQLLRGLASFIMLPIYTLHLAPADYGIVELLTVVLDLTALLIGSRVAVGIFKYYSDAPSDREKGQVMSTALALLVGANAFGVLVLWMSAGGIARLLDAPEQFDQALRYFSISLVLAAINEIFFAYLRVLDRPFAYVGTNLLKLVAQLALNIWFIVYLDMGYWGIIWAGLLSSALMTVVFSVWLWPAFGLQFSWQYARRLVGYSLPILLGSLGTYYLTFGDRYLLQSFHDLAVIGVYALAYKFGFLLFSLVWAPFATYWTAQQFNYARDPNAPQLFGDVFFYASFMLLLAAAGIIVLVPAFIHLFSAPSYWGAIEIVPWVVAAYLLHCWTDFLRFGILHTAKTGHIAYSTALAVAVITGLYLYWIPLEAGVGAAKATFWAFLVRLAYTVVVSQRLFPINIPWGRIAGTAIYFSGAVVLIRWLALPDAVAIWLNGILMVLAAALLALTPVVKRAHRDLVLGVVRGRLG